MLGHYLNLVLAETTIRYVVSMTFQLAPPPTLHYFLTFDCWRVLRTDYERSNGVKGLIVSPSGGEGGYCIDGSDYIPYGTFMS